MTGKLHQGCLPSLKIQFSHSGRLDGVWREVMSHTSSKGIVVWQLLLGIISLALIILSFNMYSSYVEAKDIDKTLTQKVEEDAIMKVLKKRFSSFRDNTDHSATCRHEPLSCDGKSNKEAEYLLKIRDAIFEVYSCDSPEKWKIYMNESASMLIACRKD